MAKNATELADAIFNFMTTSKNPALFAGAGVGVKAGLPTWPQFMEHLAKVADQHDPPTGNLIRLRSEAGYYLQAAAVYKTCPQIPPGVLYEQIAAPFISIPAVSELHGLASLPFTAVITTNYDRSLHDAVANVMKKSPNTVELSDPTMTRAPYFTDFYIARVHGRAEVPESIIFADDDYKALTENDGYIDFLHHVFTRYSCLFVGFSFVDPAIEGIFKTIQARLSPNFPRLHLAILSDDSDHRLTSELIRLNISVVKYDASPDHSVLWEGVTLTSRRFTTEQKIGKRALSIPIDTIQQFIALSYARAKLSTELQPLRDTVIDGIILDSIHRAGDKGSTVLEIAQALRQVLVLQEEQSLHLAQRRVEVLSGRGWCQVHGNAIHANFDSENAFENDFGLLVAGVINRAKVRERQQIPPQFRSIVSRCIEDVLLARSWDLGAHYAGASNRELPNILRTVELSVERRAAKLPSEKRQGLILACYDLFQNPDESESSVLAELGRVAFALQLVINSPCATIAHQAVLPERIYLDASFAMPAIVQGHPFYSLYSEALHRYTAASRTAGMQVQVAVVDDFLNEIISHREISEKEVRSLGLGNTQTIGDYTLYQGAENGNVFIGAYSQWIGNLQPKGSFDDFLNQVAPYKSETELSRFLATMGIQTPRLSFRFGYELDLFHKISHALMDAYEDDETHPFDPKEQVLIEHEARQLTRLTLDLEAGLRPFFVTADRRLRRLATGQVLGKAGGVIISHRGLVQLIDMLIGIRGDPIATTRLLWGTVSPDETHLIRDYLITKALSYQDEAMTMSLPEVLQVLVEEGVNEAKQEGISLFPGGSISDRAKRVRFLGHLEDKFYANMAEVMRQKFPEEHNFAEEIRREHLEKHIKSTLDLISEYETRQRESDDPKEKANCERELKDLRRYLDEYSRELRELTKQ